MPNPGPPKKTTKYTKKTTDPKRTFAKQSLKEKCLKHDEITGRLRASTLLNEQQQKFVHYLSLGNNQKSAAQLAGYSGPEHAAYRLLLNPFIRKAVHDARVSRLTGTACQALNVMTDLLESPSHVVQFQAARWILESAGHVAPKSLAQANDTKPLSEMTEDELAEIVRRGREEIKVLEASVQVVEPESVKADSNCSTS